MLRTPQPDLQQEVLDKLNRSLDLVLKTAEAASADNNHKVVIQAAREVTRIATLITKMTNPKTRPASRPGLIGRESQEALPKKNKADQKTGAADLKPEDLLLPDLSTLFPSLQVASLDPVSRELFDDISRGYQEMQAVGAEMAVNLKKSS